MVNGQIIRYLWSSWCCLFQYKRGWLQRQRNWKEALSKFENNGPDVPVEIPWYTALEQLKERKELAEKRMSPDGIE